MAEIPEQLDRMEIQDEKWGIWIDLNERNSQMLETIRSLQVGLWSFRTYNERLIKMQEDQQQLNVLLLQYLSKRRRSKPQEQTFNRTNGEKNKECFDNIEIMEETNRNRTEIVEESKGVETPPSKK